MLHDLFLSLETLEDEGPLEDLRDDPFFTDDIARLCESEVFMFLCHMCAHLRGQRKSSIAAAFFDPTKQEFPW